MSRKVNHQRRERSDRKEQRAEERINRLSQLETAGLPDSRVAHIARAVAATGRRLTPGVEWALSESADQKAASGMSAQEWRAREASWAAERPCDLNLPHADEANRLEQAIANLRDTGLWPWEPAGRMTRPAGRHDPGQTRSKRRKQERMTEREVARTLGNVRRITTEQLKAIDKELGASRDQIVSMARLTYQRAGRGAIFVDIHDPEAGVVAPRYALRQAFLGEGDDAEPFKDIAAALDDYDPEREAVVIMALDSALLAYRLDNQEQEQGRYNPFAII